MLWTNDCERVRRQLALNAGGDASTAEMADVRQHLRDCSGCRTAGEDLIRGQRVLAEARTLMPRNVGPSLSSHLAERVRSLPQGGKHSQRAGWIPVAALSAACAAVIMAALMNPSFDDSQFSQRSSPSVGSDSNFSGESMHWSGQEGQLILSPQMRRVRSLMYSDSNSY